MTDTPALSIILPFYNEGEGVRRMIGSLYPVLDKLNLSYELICIDDGSADNTYEFLCDEQRRDPRIRTVRFVRNFGKEAALTCGLRLARGRAAITMDSDGQHPPETLPAFVEAWKKGSKMIYGIRQNRETDSWLRRFLSLAFYALFRHIANIRLPEGAGDFRLLDRAVIDAVNVLPEKNRFMKGIMTWAGFDYAQIPFIVAPRQGGHSSWSFFRLVTFAFDGITSFSTLPLRIWTWFGGFVSMIAIFYGIFLVLRTLILGIDVPGYPSLMVAILFFGGVQLISLGIIGEYLARVFTEVKGRPIYLIADKRGFEEASHTQV